LPRIQTTRPSHLVHAEHEVLEKRLSDLEHSGGSTRAWRRLQYDAYCAMVHAQVWLVTLHGQMIALLRDDRELYERHRVESLELSLCVDSLRELIRSVSSGLRISVDAN
jgi:hypothetical protein